MDQLPPFTVWFVIAGTVLAAYRFTQVDWRFNAGAKIVLALITIAGMIILYDNHTI